MRAIAPDEVGGPYVLLEPVLMAEQALDVHIIRGESGQLGTAFDRHAGAGEMLREEALGLCLRDEKDERKPGVRGADVTELNCGDRAGSEMEHQASAGATPRDQRVSEAECVEELQGSRLNREGARFPGAIERTIDDAEAGPEPMQLGREREASRARTDDYRVEIGAGAW
jgi:hypothetical protein